MNKKWIKLSSVALMSLYLAACDTNDEETVEDESAELVEEEESAEDESTELAEEEESAEDDQELEETDEDHGHDNHHDDEDDHHDDEDDHHDHSSPDEDVQESIDIEGMAHHYHTGELVELNAVMSEDTEYSDWHWYMRENEDSDWEMISGQNSEDFIYEAPDESVEIRAVLYDDAHNPYAESAAVELEVDNH